MDEVSEYLNATVVIHFFLSFSDVKSVCNQLCKEFMSDILRITSSAEDDDITKLQTYLLEGRGWILLRLIHKTGAQVNLYCCCLLKTVQNHHHHRIFD